jgi:hypothetical protein
LEAEPLKIGNEILAFLMHVSEIYLSESVVSRELSSTLTTLFHTLN